MVHDNRDEEGLDSPGLSAGLTISTGIADAPPRSAEDWDISGLSLTRDRAMQLYDM